MRNIINAFVRHPVAPNLAMMIMVIAGIWSLGQLTRQLLPSFAINVVTVSVAWNGASAEDVEAAVTQPIEDELLDIDGLKTLKSTSRVGSSQVNLEFPGSADMGRALETVKERIDQIRNLPSTAEQPIVELIARSEPVSKVIVSGLPLEQLRPLVRRLERDIRAFGLSRLEISGLPAEQISVEVGSNRLNELNLSLQDIADEIRDASADVPAGTLGSRDVARQLRGTDQRRSVVGFEQLVIDADETGRVLTLGDIADVKRVSLPGQTRIFYDGKPAVEIQIRRSEKEDAINSAEKLYAWAERARADLPQDVQLTFFDEEWRLVNERIGLMISNALSGLVLVLIALYVFLNARVAFWVAVGIPVSVLAALVALYAFGGSINMITLLAMIMTFGIIVDDAIVVGEEAVTLYQNGAGPLAAARGAALRMFAPVTAASLTTIAAFSPLLTIQGVSGSILFGIPLVVICVVIASLVECFVVLPGHLRHSLQGVAEHKPNKLRRAFEARFNHFREVTFRGILQKSVENRGTTLAIAGASIILAIGLLAGGRIGFTFFPQPDGTTIVGNARFVAGAPEYRVEAFLAEAEQAALRAEAELGEDIIKFVIRKVGSYEGGSEGSNVGHLLVELTAGDAREISNADFIAAWEKQVLPPAGLESFLIASSTVGPNGADIDVSLSGASADTLKAAADELKAALAEFPGVAGITDDATYGKEQLLFEISPTGNAIGLTSDELGSQLRAAFEGELVQIFQDAGEEIEVRVRLAESERESVRVLDQVPIIAPSGEVSSLANVADLQFKRGFESLLHTDGLLTMTVTADVDFRINNSNAIRAQLSRSVLPELAERYGVLWSYGGEAADQQEGLGGIGLAMPIALITIYIILAWVFASYTWPLAVLSIIPFGIVGALVGHWIMDFNLTMLSIFGIFGLSGIVINDAIILVTVFKERREAGDSPEHAAIEAGVRRFRAVMLTSLTTVAGIMPLLFERALQAQFLKPMVISISFGLIFGTLIVLFLLPAFLVGIESLKQRVLRIRSRFPQAMMARETYGALLAGRPEDWTFEDPVSSSGKNNRNAS